MNESYPQDGGGVEVYHIYEVSLYVACSLSPRIFCSPALSNQPCTVGGNSFPLWRTVTWWACQNLACPWNGILRLPRTWLNESYQGWWWQAFCQGQTLHKVFCIFTVSRSLLQLTAFCHSWHLRQRWSKENNIFHKDSPCLADLCKCQNSPEITSRKDIPLDSPFRASIYGKKCWQKITRNHQPISSKLPYGNLT